METDKSLQPDSKEDEINEAEYLREEDRRIKVQARYAEMDRRDRAGPHYWAR